MSGSQAQAAASSRGAFSPSASHAPSPESLTEAALEAATRPAPYADKSPGQFAVVQLIHAARMQDKTVSDQFLDSPGDRQLGKDKYKITLEDAHGHAFVRVRNRHVKTPDILVPLSNVKYLEPVEK